MKKSELENNEEYVECNSCGHIISKKRAQIVDMYGFTEVRCDLHKLPFDEAHGVWGGNRYFKRIEVDVNGTPIGYKKITTKKK